IQLSNTGITPGAGVRNKREGINEKSLNIPVIAIGVPTVVDMATITNETIDKMLDATKIQMEKTNPTRRKLTKRKIFHKNKIYQNFLLKNA
ncbi:MAG: GPR endopeptidase, partial [Treponemataceae bacterium]|nr:GPR endopeptidase [Treponemataceae bacterium]